MIATWIINVIVTTMCVSVVVALVDRMARVTERPRRWVWASGMLLSVVLPTIALRVQWHHPVVALMLRIPIVRHLVQAWVAPKMMAPLVLATMPMGLNRLPVTTGLSVGVVVSTTCVIVSVVGVLLFFGVQGWFRVRRAQWPETQIEGISAVISPSVGPAVVGVFRPVVVLPGWVLGVTEETQRMIIEHESEHVRAGDSIVLTVMGLLLAVMPWNVVLWWQYRRLREAIEIDCDARVLRRGTNVRQYGEVLLRVASQTLEVPILSAAFGASVSVIERRIRMMTGGPSRYRSVQMSGLAGAAFATMMLAYDSSSFTTALRSLLVSPATGVIQYHCIVADVMPRTAHGCVIVFPGKPALANAKAALYEGAHTGETVKAPEYITLTVMPRTPVVPLDIVFQFQSASKNALQVTRAAVPRPRS